MSLITEEELKEMCIEYGDFTLSSGKKSDHHYNLERFFCERPADLVKYFEMKIINESKWICTAMKHSDCIVAKEPGGALIASGIASVFHIPIAIYRKNGEHLNKPYGKSLIIDDVKTTGKTIAELENWCRECGAEVVQVVVGIDRSKEEVKK